MGKRTEVNVLEDAAVPGMDGLFVLGCLARRVTLCSQQIRALNLVHALVEAGRIGKGVRVAIIGAGGAGLTAAAAVTCRHGEASVFERADTPLHLQSGCHTRWLHPRIYDWPNPGWDDPDAGLPLLNWKAESAHAVTQQLLAGFALVCKEKPRCGMRHVEIVAAGDKWRIVWSDGKGNGDEVFDLVILAVGFGIEHVVPYAPRLSYWRLDTLEQTPLDVGAETPVYVISGTGDGGLIDVLRAGLIGFNHKDIVTDYLSVAAVETPGGRALQRKLLAIEEEAQKLAATTGKPEANAFLTRAYYDLRVPAWFDAKLKNRARDIKVVLLGRDPSPLTLNTAIHNRFLVSRLLRNGVQYRVGELHRVEAMGFNFRAYIRGSTKASAGREDTIDAHRVVVRHGSEPALRQVYPAIWKSIDDAKPRPVDPAMPKPLWPNGFYQPPTRSSATSRKAGASVGKAGKKDLRLLAEFQLDPRGVPQSFETGDAKHYWITLSIGNAPAEVSFVRYHLYEDYPEPEVEILKGPDFKMGITSYGDFVVRVKLSNGKVIRCLLSNALKAGHSAAVGPLPRPIRAAIETIRKN